MEEKIAAVTSGFAGPEIPVVRGKAGRPRGKYSDPKKPYVISMRMSDDEMMRIKELMQVTNKGASELMREAFQLFKSQVMTNQTSLTATKLFHFGA